MNFSETISSGLVVFVIGIGTVFAVLMILWGVLELMRVIFAPKDAKPAKTETVVPQPEPAPAVSEAVTEESVDDDELIAVLTAAVAASLNTSTYRLNIKSYRQIPSSAPVWNSVSRRENLN